LFSQGKAKFPYRRQLASWVRVPRDAELRLKRGQTNLRSAARSTAGNPMFGRRAFQFQIGKFSCSVFTVRDETR
jgi:hypothetical protein